MSIAFPVASIDQLTRTIDELQREVALLEEEQAKCREAASKVPDLEAECQRLRDEQAAGRLPDLEAECQRLRDGHAQLEGKIQRLRQICRAQKDELITLRREKDQWQSETNNTIQALTDERLKLQESNETLLEEERRKVIDLDSQKKLQSEKIAILETENKRLVAELDALKKSPNDPSPELFSLVSELQQDNRKLANLCRLDRDRLLKLQERIAFEARSPAPQDPSPAFTTACESLKELVRILETGDDRLMDSPVEDWNAPSD